MATASADSSSPYTSQSHSSHSHKPARKRVFILGKAITDVLVTILPPTAREEGDWNSGPTLLMVGASSMTRASKIGSWHKPLGVGCNSEVCLSLNASVC